MWARIFFMRLPNQKQGHPQSGQGLISVIQGTNRPGGHVGLALFGTLSTANHFSADTLSSVWFIY